MDTGKKAALAGTSILVLAVSVRVGLIYRERNAPAPPAPSVREKIPADDLVFLKKKRPDSLADLQQLDGTTLWVSAGGQMEYYPYAKHHVEYARPAGTLLGAQPLQVKEAVEQVAPKAATFRIPAGDRQVLLVFTLPPAKDPSGAVTGNPTNLYAVPVGYRQDGQYTFYTDEIFFYDDPHDLYKHWGPRIWKAIDAHQVIDGMNERQVQLSLGQVSKSLSNDYGNRLVVYSNLGHPIAVTFVKNQVTSFRPES